MISSRLEKEEDEEDEEDDDEFQVRGNKRYNRLLLLSSSSSKMFQGEAADCIENVNDNESFVWPKSECSMTSSALVEDVQWMYIFVGTNVFVFFFSSPFSSDSTTMLEAMDEFAGEDKEASIRFLAWWMWLLKAHSLDW